MARANGGLSVTYVLGSHHGGPEWRFSDFCQLLKNTLVGLQAAF